VASIGRPATLTHTHTHRYRRTDVVSVRLAVLRHCQTAVVAFLCSFMLPSLSFCLPLLSSACVCVSVLCVVVRLHLCVCVCFHILVCMHVVNAAMSLCKLPAVCRLLSLLLSLMLLLLLLLFLSLPLSSLSFPCPCPAHKPARLLLVTLPVLAAAATLAIYCTRTRFSGSSLPFFHFFNKCFVHSAYAKLSQATINAMLCFWLLMLAFPVVFKERLLATYKLTA